MTRQIPRAALILGLGGLIPFVYGAAAILWPVLDIGAAAPRALLETYGTIILSFMAGTLWGFAVKGGADLWRWLTFSVIPAVLLVIGAEIVGLETIYLLLFGFPALLLLDVAFARAGLVPGWWMRLRLLLTVVVTASLAIGAFP